MRYSPETHSERYTNVSFGAVRVPSDARIENGRKIDRLLSPPRLRQRRRSTPQPLSHSHFLPPRRRADRSRSTPQSNRNKNNKNPPWRTYCQPVHRSERGRGGCVATPCRPRSGGSFSSDFVVVGLRPGRAGSGRLCEVGSSSSFLIGSGGSFVAPGSSFLLRDRRFSPASFSGSRIARRREASVVVLPRRRCGVP
jgi:hypothetical protein